MSQRLAIVAASIALGTVGIVPSPALAEVTKMQCIAANTEAQNLRRDDKFAEAREQLRRCIDPQCPSVVRTDCTKRLDELEAAQPTIVFDVTDSSGKDVSEIAITVDERRLADHLDGTALPVDPGKHTFRVEAVRQGTVVQTLIVQEGVKMRHERITLGATDAVTGATVMGGKPRAASEDRPFHDGIGARKTAGLVAGGVGIAGLAVGGIFAGLTAAAIGQQHADCLTSTICSRYGEALSAHATWTTDGNVATAAFIAGGALLAAGAVVYLLPRHGAEPAPAPSVALSPSVAPSAVGMLIQGSF